MIALYKTKTDFNFQYNRKNYTGIIYVEVNTPIRSASGYIPQGRYYTFIQDGVSEEVNENNETVQVPNMKKIVLDSFTGSISFSQVKQIEDNILSDFTNIRNIDDAFVERTKQFTMIKIDSEHQEDSGTNWGITSNDLEEIINENI